MGLFNVFTSLFDSYSVVTKWVVLGVLLCLILSLFKLVGLRK